MVNANYVKGRAFEHRVRKIKESNGYTVVRSAGSKGAIDLIAWDQFSFELIQCKIYNANTKKPLRTDIELLKTVPTPGYGRRVLAWKCNGQSGWKEEIV